MFEVLAVRSVHQVANHWRQMEDEYAAGAQGTIGVQVGDRNIEITHTYPNSTWTDEGMPPPPEADDTGDQGGGQDITGLPPVRRYLLGRFPDTVRPGQVFSLLVSVVRSAGAPPERAPEAV